MEIRQRKRSLTAELIFHIRAATNRPMSADRQKRTVSRDRGSSRFRSTGKPKPAPSADEWPRKPQPVREPEQPPRETPSPKETTLPAMTQATIQRPAIPSMPGYLASPLVIRWTPIHLLARHHQNLWTKRQINTCVRS